MTSPELEKVYKLLEETVAMAYKAGYEDGTKGHRPFTFEAKKLSRADRLRIKNYLMEVKRYTGHVR